MTNEEKCRALGELLRDCFTCYRSGEDLVFKSDASVDFTFEQMMKLPAILGSERLNFGTSVGYEPCYSEVTPGGEYAELTITVLGGAK